MTVRRGGSVIRRWRAGDPFLAEDGLEAARKTIRESVFRQLRLGQWVTGVEVVAAVGSVGCHASSIASWQPQ